MQTLMEERQKTKQEIEEFRKEKEEYLAALKKEQQKENEKLKEVLNWEKQALADHKKDMYQMLKEEEAFSLGTAN